MTDNTAGQVFNTGISLSEPLAAKLGPKGSVGLQQTDGVILVLQPKWGQKRLESSPVKRDLTIWVDGCKKY